MAQRLFDRLESTGNLPTPQGVVFKILDLTRREDASARSWGIPVKMAVDFVIHVDESLPMAQPLFDPPSPMLVK